MAVKTWWARRAPAVALATVLASACATIQPPPKPVTDVPSAGRFPHERLGLVLTKAVSPEGLVDYGVVSQEETLLDEYLAELARISPESHAHLFPTEADRLAYWINAHNACALRSVLRWNRPTRMTSIEGRFDHAKEFVLGGKKMSLLDIVNYLRGRFNDPRVHFVLVRARRGGPPLSKEPFLPASLEQQLEAAARASVDDSRFVQWEPPSLEVRLSRVILDYRGDFESVISATVSGDPRLIAGLNRWRPARRQLVANSVAPIPFDERLNDISNK